jgi:hypothetical protein
MYGFVASLPLLDDSCVHRPGRISYYFRSRVLYPYDNYVQQ